MKSVYAEKYQTLENMKPGDVAVSKDRSQVFVCGNHYNEESKTSERTILDMNDLSYESGSRDMTTQIKILNIGDRFDFEK